jgi:hypothetical protein
VKQVLFFLAIAAIGLVLTNPNRAAYETYGVEQITDLMSAGS